ncbi:hypothetical protein ACJX0J_011125 [Zea mays]
MDLFRETLTLNKKIYSGYLDMTFMHADWVWALALRGNTIASTTGINAYVWDIRDDNLTSLISNAHVGSTYSIAWTHLADDGAIRLFNEDIKPVATWLEFLI